MSSFFVKRLLQRYKCYYLLLSQICLFSQLAPSSFFLHWKPIPELGFVWFSLSELNSALDPLPLSVSTRCSLCCCFSERAKVAELHRLVSLAFESRIVMCRRRLPELRWASEVSGQSPGGAPAELGLWLLRLGTETEIKCSSQRGGGARGTRSKQFSNCSFMQRR